MPFADKIGVEKIWPTPELYGTQSNPLILAYTYVCSFAAETFIAQCHHDLFLANISEFPLNSLFSPILHQIFIVYLSRLIKLTQR